MDLSTDTRTETEKACQFFSCRQSGIAILDALYYLGVLACGSFGFLQNGISPGSEEVTSHFKTLAAGETQVIPVGAKGYSVSILTGTATIEGEAVPAGYSVGEEKKLLATVTVTCDTPGTATVSWDT